MLCCQIAALYQFAQLTITSMLIDTFCFSGILQLKEGRSSNELLDLL